MFNLNTKINKLILLTLLIGAFFVFHDLVSVQAAKLLELPSLEVAYEPPLLVTSFTGLIGNFLARLQAIIGWLAVIMIVIGGIVYITSTGRTSQIELGKKILTFALIGFVLAVAAPSILKELIDLARTEEGTTPSDVIENAKSAQLIARDILGFVISLIGIIATFGFVISGVLFVAAGGDTSKADKARKGLTYSIIGVTVAGAALILVRQVFQLMGANL